MFDTDVIAGLVVQLEARNPSCGNYVIIQFFIVSSGSYLCLGDDTLDTGDTCKNLGNDLVLGLVIRVSVIVHPSVSGVQLGDSQSIGVVLQVHSKGFGDSCGLYLYICNHVNRM